MLFEYTCEKCQKPLKHETYKDINLVLWVNHGEPDHATCLPCWNALSEEEKTEIYDKAQHKPQVYQQGMASWWHPRKERLVHRIMEHLNERLDYRTKFYDCEELGTLCIWWGRGVGWQWSWVNVRQLPVSLCGET